MATQAPGLPNQSDIKTQNDAIMFIFAMMEIASKRGAWSLDEAALLSHCRKLFIADPSAQQQSQQPTQPSIESAQPSQQPTAAPLKSQTRVPDAAPRANPAVVEI
jgi:hypothetical protein